ncbi:MAG: 3D domain-containing protein [Porcipelethomonas sp.]
MKKAFIALIVSLIFTLATCSTASAVTWKLYVSKYGTCRVTAYSGNNGSTYGASGNTLIPKKSCAASRDIPLGTELYIKDFGIVTVEDRMAEWYEEEYDNMVIDLYLESYSDACDWGMQELEVYIINDKEVIYQEDAK